MNYDEIKESIRKHEGYQPTYKCGRFLNRGNRTQDKRGEEMQTTEEGWLELLIRILK